MCKYEQIVEVKSIILPTTEVKLDGMRVVTRTVEFAEQVTEIFVSYDMWGEMTVVCIVHEGVTVVQEQVGYQDEKAVSRRSIIEELPTITTRHLY